MTNEQQNNDSRTGRSQKLIPLPSPQTIDKPFMGSTPESCQLMQARHRAFAALAADIILTEIGMLLDKVQASESGIPTPQEADAMLKLSSSYRRMKQLANPAKNPRKNSMQRWREIVRSFNLPG